MVILGIDPGLASTGFGVIRKEGADLRSLEHGVIETPPGAVLSLRLDKIYREVVEVIRSHQPDVVVLEQLFFSSNAKSAMAVGEARGAIILAAAHAGAEVAQYTPLQIKQALVGEGRASKEQVSFMVRSILRLEPIASDHASDALAAAICHAHRYDLQERLKGAAVTGGTPVAPRPAAARGKRSKSQ